MSRATRVDFIMEGCPPELVAQLRAVNELARLLAVVTVAVPRENMQAWRDFIEAAAVGYGGKVGSPQFALSEMIDTFVSEVMPDDILPRRAR